MYKYVADARIKTGVANGRRETNLPRFVQGGVVAKHIKVSGTDGNRSILANDIRQRRAVVQIQASIVRRAPVSYKPDQNSTWPALFNTGAVGPVGGVKTKLPNRPPPSGTKSPDSTMLLIAARDD